MTTTELGGDTESESIHSSSDAFRKWSTARGDDLGRQIGADKNDYVKCCTSAVGYVRRSCEFGAVLAWKHPVERQLALVGLLDRFDIALDRKALLATPCAPAEAAHPARPPAPPAAWKWLDQLEG